MDPLSSSWHKYRRAREHAQAVDRIIQRIFDPNLDLITFEVQMERQGAEIVATGCIAKLPIIHERVGLAIGDAVQNFRSALDHLAYDLVRIGGRRLNSDQLQRVQFPIHKTAAGFRAGLNGRLPGVPKDHWAIIRRNQPYRRGEGPQAIRWLQRLSNMDKHRVLIPSVVSLRHATIDVRANLPLVSHESLISPDMVLKIGTPITKVRCAITAGATECRVDMDGRLTVYPSLGYRMRMSDLLGLIDKAVFGILEEFDEIV